MTKIYPYKNVVIEMRALVDMLYYAYDCNRTISVEDSKQRFDSISDIICKHRHNIKPLLDVIDELACIELEN